MNHALYRKINDRTCNSSSYHKKDDKSTCSCRAILKEDANREIKNIYRDLIV